MVLTDRQRSDLHAGIYEYLRSQPGEAFQRAAQAILEADPQACSNSASSNGTKATIISNGVKPTAVSSSSTPLLEKKWVAIPRLQKKVMELERLVAQSAKIHAHRQSLSGNPEDNNAGGTLTTSNSGSSGRRMLPRQPYLHKLQGHSAVVTCVAIHPVFTMAASGSEDGTIKIWDHESGEFIKTLKGHTNTVNGLDFTPRGTHLASCSTDLSIKLWDLRMGGNAASGQYVCVRTLRGHDHTISAVKFMPLPTLSLLSERENQNNTHNNSNNNSSGGSGGGGVQASIAGCQYLLSASRDTTVKVWDVETGFCDHTVTDHSDWVRCLAVQASPLHSGSNAGGSGGLWASSGNDTVIHMYEGRRHLMELRGHEHVVESLAFVTEEALKSTSSSTVHSKHHEQVRDYLASGSRDRTVRLWKISEATCLATFVAHENWVRSVLIHPSGKYIISAADDKSIRVFDIQANRCLRVLDKAHDHFVTSLAMHHTLPILVSGGVDQTVRCWQLD